MVIIYVCLALLGVFLFLKTRSKRRNWNVPPGPKGLPLVGCALEINERNTMEKFFAYAEEYGEIFHIKLLHENFICLNSEGLIRKVLATEPYQRYMNDRAKFFFAEYIYYGSQSVVFYGDAHSSVHSGMRKGIIKALHVYGQEGMNDFEINILGELERLNKKLESFGDKDFDIVALLQRSLTNILSLLLSGEVLFDDDKDINMFWEYIDGVDFFVQPSVNNLLTMFPWLRFVPGFRRKYKYMSEAKRKIVRRFFDTRKNKGKDGQRGLVDQLFEEQKRSLKEGREVIFTDERIICAILESVVAGILTTWSVLSSTILCLVNHPEYQDKVFEELEKNISRDRQPDHSDKINCPHLEALEMEVHRLMTVVPILGGRICTQDSSLEGYNIAKGTLLLVNIWYMHHNPKIWGDPWTFRPERFLDDDGQLLPRDHVYRRNWIPFAIGRRQCLGEQFARTRYFMYMTTLLRRWKFVGSPGKFGPFNPRNLENMDTNLTLRPKPFFCTVESRS